MGGAHIVVFQGKQATEIFLTCRNTLAYCNFFYHVSP
jgi:hypothetical protein